MVEGFVSKGPVSLKLEELPKQTDISGVASGASGALAIAYSSCFQKSGAVILGVDGSLDFFGPYLTYPNLLGARLRKERERPRTEPGPRG